MENPKVSIVIPVHNGEQYVDACMKSMEEQSYANLELIIVDDGSKDNTGIVCDEYAAKDKRLKVIHQENKGVSSARNAGIRNATGEYILFVDIDDTIEKDTVKDNVALAEKHKADMVMFCFWYYHVDEDELVPNEMDEIFVGSDEEYFHKKLIQTIDNEMINAPWNKLIRRSILMDHHITFNENYSIYEDVAFVFLVLKECKKIVVNNKMYYKYFLKSSGSLITGFYEKYFEAVTHYYKNAMEYCGRYENSTKQRSRINQSYCVLTIMHIKQIACNKNLTHAKAIQMLERIFTDEGLQKALEDAHLKEGKKIVCGLIKRKNYNTCILLYRIIAAIQQAKAERHE